MLTLFTACAVVAAPLPSFQIVFERVKGESPPFLDADGDGKPEIVPHWEDQWGFIQPDWSEPTRPWTFKPITDKRKWEQFAGALLVPAHAGRERRRDFCPAPN